MVQSVHQAAGRKFFLITVELFFVILCNKFGGVNGGNF